MLLLYTDAPFYRHVGYDAAWIEALTEIGCECDTLAGPPPDWPAGGPPAGRWDLVIPHVLVEEVAAYAPTLRAAALLEACGHALLNPVASIVASSDKLVTHAVWARHGLRQPRSHDLATLERWPDPDGRPMVLKPAFCDGARHISLVRSLGQAREIAHAWREDEARGGERRGPAVLQQWIEEPVVTRLFATPDATSPAYVKSRRPGAIVTHGTVYPEVHEPSPAMARLARAMVATLGGGLMGVDVLTDCRGRHHALEANAPFGFDVTDPEQGRFVARAARRAAEARVGGMATAGR
jgi:[lysine-biosynthesis-protein LysW]---L-2-aminoadipate ligase